MNPTRAELLGAYAVLHKVQQRPGTMRIWVDNDNLVRGLEKMLGIERADSVWAVAEDWTADSREMEPSWRVQLGVGADGDQWEAMDLLLGRMEGEERRVLDQLPAELSEQAYMWQWDLEVDGDSYWRQEWLCSGWKPGAGEEQLGIVDWVVESLEQEGAEEGFAEGAEQQYEG
jgi:hypothetical protein